MIFFLLTDEILGYFTSFPHEEETVQLSSLDNAWDIHSSLLYGKYNAINFHFSLASLTDSLSGFVEAKRIFQKWKALYFT